MTHTILHSKKCAQAWECQCRHVHRRTRGILDVLGLARACSRLLRAPLARAPRDSHEARSIGPLVHRFSSKGIKVVALHEYTWGNSSRPPLLLTSIPILCALEAIAEWRAPNVSGICWW